MTTKEFAQVLGISPRTVGNWRLPRNGKSARLLPDHYDGRIAVYTEEQIPDARALLAQGERTDLTSVRNLTNVDTKKEIAKAAVVSHDTIAKVEKIEQQATPEIKQSHPAPTFDTRKKNNAESALLNTADDTQNISANNTKHNIAQNRPATQAFRNMPEEILSAPRFFPVNADKTPKANAWSQPNNQKLYSYLKGLVGFDTCGHQRGEDYLLLDFDHVLNPDTGEFINDAAERWLNYIQGTFDGYCERSISGDGVHILAIPTQSKFGKISNKVGQGVLHFDPNNPDIKLEVFYKQAARYCLLTGNLFRTESREIPKGEIVDAVLADILRAIADTDPAEKKKAQPTPRTADTQKFPPEIQSLVDRINNISAAELTGKGYLKHSEKGAPEPYGYICPWCSSGTHEHKTGALQFYSEPNNNHVHCHARSCHGDIIALLAQCYGMDISGKEFFAVIRRAADEFGIEYDPKIFEPRTQRAPALVDDEDEPDNSNTQWTQDLIADCPVNLRVPDGFIFSKRGIFYIVPAKRNQAETYICVANSPIVPTRIFCRNSDGTVTYEVAIRKKNNWWRAVVDGRTLIDPRRVLELADKKACIEDAPRLAKFFARIISANEYELEETKIFNKPGWQKDDTFIDPTGGDGYICERSGIDYEELFETRGDSSLWRKKLQEIIGSSSQGSIKRGIIGAAAACPALKILRLPNFCVHLLGRYSFAKSPLLKFALSIYGNPSEGALFRSWDSTAKNRTAMAAGLCDFPQGLDELESLSKKDRAELSKNVYDFVSGIANQANRRDGTVRTAEKFRGVRLSTGESPLLKETDKGGTFKRVLTFRATQPLFEDEYAHKLHIFCERNHGHFRRTWINYISEHKDDLIADFDRVIDGMTHSNRIDARFFDSTHIRAIAACVTAFYHFSIAVNIDTAFEINGAIFDACELLAEMPTTAEICDTGRAINVLASYVDEHPKNFIHYGDKSGTVEGALSFAGTDGIIFDDGRVGLFRNACRKICEDNSLPPFEKILNELFDEGKIDAPNRREKAKSVRLGKEIKKVYMFKSGVLITVVEDNDKEESADELARQYGF